MSRPMFPTIAPLPEGTPRPFWSVMIPAYNRTTYLERTLRSVLEQAPGAEEMQIAVLDNASPAPEVEAMVREIGGERVEFVRHPVNLGMVGNWNSCIQHARGHWIHILHDDDMVRPDYYTTYRQFIEAHADVELVFSRSIFIDQDDNWLAISQIPLPQNQSGYLENALFRFVTESIARYLYTPSVVVNRRAYERVGGFNMAAQSNMGFDWQMWIRVANAGKVGYIQQPLALYRMHNSNACTYSMVQDQENSIRDYESMFRFAALLLPPEQRELARPLIRRLLAHEARGWFAEASGREHLHAALRYARWAFHNDPSISSFWYALLTSARLLKRRCLN